MCSCKDSHKGGARLPAAIAGHSSIHDNKFMGFYTSIRHLISDHARWENARNTKVGVSALEKHRLCKLFYTQLQVLDIKRRELVC